MIGFGFGFSRAWVFTETPQQGKHEGRLEASHVSSMACLVDGASPGRRGAATADRREERYKLMPKLLMYKEDGASSLSWTLWIDLVLGRARRARAAAAARRKSRE